MSARTTRRSFLSGAATAVAAAHSMATGAYGQPAIPGFDQTRTEYDRHNGRSDGFVGDNAGKKRLNKAIKKGVQTKKYALPPGVSPGGHGGSHGYLADDLLDAILRGRRPAVDVIDALNMTVPGYYAHLSATKDGETVKIPQYSL